MEPNKFEETIRTKLEERELQPSAEAWNKLEAKLGPSTTTNKTLWYAIAASLVAILVVGSFLLKRNDPVSTIIVEQTTPSSTNQETEVATSNESRTSDPAETKGEVRENLDPTTKSLPKRTQNKKLATTNTVAFKKAEQTAGILKQPPSAEIVQAEKIDTKLENQAYLENDAFIHQKIEEVVAHVENRQNANATLDPEYIEGLLLKAQKEIANQRVLQQAATTVDPASLLNDVESELERGFRDKVFDALGAGFNKIRTAVVERNN